MKGIKVLFSALLLTTAASVFAAPKYISPNNDGIQDELVIPLNISDKRYVQGWSLVIMDSNRNVVRTIENKVALPEKLKFKSFFKQLVTPKQGVQIPETVSWNGALNNGETAPDGTYYYYVTASDDNGNVGKTKEYTVIVDSTHPEIELIQPADKTFGEGAKSSLKFVQSGSKEDEWVGTFRNAEGQVVRTYKWTNAEPAEFSWFGTDDQDAQVADGIYSYEITATDRAGNTSAETIVTNIIFSADKPSTNIYIEGSKYFSPKTASKLQNVDLSLSIPVPDPRTGNRLTEWEVGIVSLAKNGEVVKSFTKEKDGDVPPSEIVFDGVGDNGLLLPDGEYQAYVIAKYLNGYVPEKISSPVFVIDTQAPVAQINMPGKEDEIVFGAGSKADVTFPISIYSEGSPVPAWTAEIKTKDESRTVKTYHLGEFPPESITWNGVTDNGALADNDSYILVVSASDLAGNAGGGKSTKAVRFDTTDAQLILALSDTAFSSKNPKKNSVTVSPVTKTEKITSYEFIIKDDNGNAVYTKSAKTSKLPAAFVWDGKRDDKTYCEDGQYTAQLSFVAENGASTDAVTQPITFDTKAPYLAVEYPWIDFSPDGDGNQDTFPVQISECTNEALWTYEVKNASNKTILKSSWSGTRSELVWDGTDEAGNLVADGKYTITISSTDAAGNSFAQDITGINVDKRETKLFLTAEFEGISPNNDGTLDSQIFEIKTTVADGLKSWEFNVTTENGTSVFNRSDKDSAVLPSTITWNGADKDGNACEGTFVGTLSIVYNKGNVVSSVSSPFICTATPPAARVQTAPEYFSPDNDGIDDDLFIKLTGSSKAKIKNWSFIIKDPKGKVFWKTEGKNQITERIIWDGLSNVQKDANGNAERVQSAMDYPYTFTIADNLGMVTTVDGIIPVDVLVIREGNVLKMAVPSIIFESDASNFQTANSKLTDAQVNKNVEILNRIADILKKFPDYKVTIQGHANRVSDNLDEETVDNMKVWGRALGPLSKERADAISAYLIKRGVSAANISTEGKGGTRPVVNPKDSDNNWKNRRVEFILVK